MDAPNEETRAYVHALSERLSSEAELEALLGYVDMRVDAAIAGRESERAMDHSVSMIDRPEPATAGRGDVGYGDDVQRAQAFALEDLAAVESWASLASYAVAHFYAPTSPWPRDVAGWGKEAVEQLRSIAEKLRTALADAARFLGANSFSIGVGFPWGISVGLSWPIDGQPG
jgi:hypothetical protein